MRYRTARRSAKLVLIGAPDVSDDDLGEVGMLVARRLRKPFFRQHGLVAGATSPSTGNAHPEADSWLAAMLAVSGPAVIASAAHDVADSFENPDRCVVLLDTGAPDAAEVDDERPRADAVVTVGGRERNTLVEAIASAWSQWAERHDIAASGAEPSDSTPT